MSEAEENDQKLVESLSGDTNSMLILVRGAFSNFNQCRILSNVTEWPFLCHSCEFHRRNIPGPSTRQRPADRGPALTARLWAQLYPIFVLIFFQRSTLYSFKYRHSLEYPYVSQSLSEHDKRPGSRSHPAMVPRIHEVRVSPCGATQARSSAHILVPRPQSISNEDVHVWHPRACAPFSIPIFLGPQRFPLHRQYNCWGSCPLLSLRTGGCLYGTQHLSPDHQ